MNPAHRVALEDKPQGKDINAVIQGLTEFNRLQTGGAMPEYVLVTVRDEPGTLLGGLFGATYLGWLQVHSVWLPDALRGRGYGTELMAIAEREATRRGCSHVLLETYSFQALPFYEKCGYTVFSRLDNFPPGGARYALTKRLTADA
jgi:GNAT superfamily N-acetyltransferase